MAPKPCQRGAVSPCPLSRATQSLPEEEQQRVLGEEKMLGSNRKGATSPASKKSSPETGKVRAAAAAMGPGVGRGCGSLRGLTPAVTACSPPQASSEKPKRPISAMFIFSEEKRKQLQEERPELSESELTRLLARMWNDLSEKKKVGAVPILLLHPCLHRASPSEERCSVLVLLRGLPSTDGCHRLCPGWAKPTLKEAQRGP